MKRIYDNQADIPAGLESYYEEKDGKFVRNDSMIEAVPAASADVSRLTKALEAERTAHKTTKAQIATKEAERVAAVEQAETLRIQVEAGGGKADDKIAELVKARVAAQIAPLNQSIDQLKTQLGEKDNAIVAFQTEQRNNRIAAAVRAEAVKAKVVDTGIDDVTEIAVRVMDIDPDTGKVSVRDGSGFTPGLDPTGFIAELQTKKPHLWPTSQGGGARGGNGGGALMNWGKMSMTDRANYVRQNGMDKANQLAKAAGFADATALKPTAS